MAHSPHFKDQTSSFSDGRLNGFSIAILVSHFVHRCTRDFDRGTTNGSRHMDPQLNMNKTITPTSQV